MAVFLCGATLDHGTECSGLICAPIYRQRDGHGATRRSEKQDLSARVRRESRADLKMHASVGIPVPPDSRAIVLSEIEAMGGAERSVLALSRWLRKRELTH